MNALAIAFLHQLLHAVKNLLPIVAVVLLFQLLILRQVPADAPSLAGGLLIVAAGVALFLQGLELGIFPVGKSLANQFARRGSTPLLLSFGFCLGFSAVVAEPALISVATQAQEISNGLIDALTLRLLVAGSVGGVTTLGVLRTILGHPIHWYLIPGYLLVIALTWFAPPEIIGLAYDSGGVTTNVVTVPLIAALGIGLSSSIRGRHPLHDGFGLVALAVMVPMISVQLYGIWVYADSIPGTALALASPEQVERLGRHWLQDFVFDLSAMLRDALPILGTILVFQYLVLRRPLGNPRQLLLGFMLVILGLYAFALGLKLGLFPIGRRMAEQLLEREGHALIYLFAFLIGFATTLAEPALLAISKQAEEAAAGQVRGGAVRLLVAFGVAIGITIGVWRLIQGDPIHLYILASYLLVILLTLFTPRHILALAFDLGGVTTSEVTVPLITALGIGLATQIDGRNALIDGFGLIAFASIFPVVSVMLYAIWVERCRQPGSRGKNR